MLNSRLGLFTAATSLWLPFSLSYGVILPSSLTTLLPLALEFSSHLPVSVCGTVIYAVPYNFSRPNPYLLPYLFSVPFAQLNQRLGSAISKCPSGLRFGGYGISTVCASATPSGLALAPAYLGRTNLPLETLDFRPLRFSRNSRYSFRHSHSN